MYLTDVLAIARAAAAGVSAHLVEDLWQTEGVNDQVQLARMGTELNRRIAERWMREGVTIVDPDTTWIDADVTIAPRRDHPARHPALGATTVGADAVVVRTPPRRHRGRSARRGQEDRGQPGGHRRRRHRRSVLLPAPRHGPRREGQDRRLRRDEERRHRRGRQGAAPDLLRRRDDR